MTGPLSGIRVLEFSVVVAAPLAGMHLADMGAAVTKVEALEGDSFRYAQQVVPTAGGKLFTWFNRGKRGITLNLQDERARRIVQHLVRDTDVVLVNYRPGVAERLGIDYPTLSEFRPDLIYADITGFGRHGPLAHRAGMDIVAQAFAGTTATFGRLDQEGNPSTTQVAISDVSTGIACVGAVLAALYHRERTGEGQLVELALVRSAMSFIGWILARDPISDPLLVAPIVGDMEEARARGGGYREIIGARNQHEFRVAQGPYYGGFDARDGGFSMGASTPGNRARLRKLFGIEGDRSDDPDYDALDPDNIAKMAEIEGRIRARVKEKTVAEWEALLDKAGIPVSRINFPEHLPDHPHARQFMVDVEHPLLGVQQQVGPLWGMSKTAPEVRGPAPLLGEHTDEVLRECGYAAEAIAELREQGVIGPAP